MTMTMTEAARRIQERVEAAAVAPRICPICGHGMGTAICFKCQTWTVRRPDLAEGKK